MALQPLKALTVPRGSARLLAGSISTTGTGLSSPVEAGVGSTKDEFML